MLTYDEVVVPCGSVQRLLDCRILLREVDGRRDVDVRLLQQAVGFTESSQFLADVHVLLLNQGLMVVGKSAVREALPADDPEPLLK